MKRVEVNIDEAFRGIVAEYAEKHSLSMPQAYAELLANGILASTFDIEKEKEQVVKKEARTQSLQIGRMEVE